MKNMLFSCFAFYSLSYLRRQVSSKNSAFWIPAFAGMTSRFVARSWQKMATGIMLCLLFLLPMVANAQDNAVLEKAENYLNNITTLKADFTQIAPDGNVATGMLYIKKPGQMRWEYAPPVPVIMVSATGNFLRYIDYELEQVSEIPIKDSLAAFLVERNIDFSDERIKVLEAGLRDGIHTVKVTQANQPDEGELTFEFSSIPYQLRRIILKDAKGEETVISLQGAEYNIPLKEELFVLRDITFNKRNRR